MKEPSKNNPYFKKETKSEPGPILARLPFHRFKDGGDMEQSLMPFEACIASVPNTKNTGMEEHVAFVYKDGDGKVYSIGLYSHHGLLKDTKENDEAMAILIKEQKDGN